MLKLLLWLLVLPGQEPKPLDSSKAQALAKKYFAEPDAAKKEAMLAEAAATPADDPAPYLKLILPKAYDPGAKKGVQHGLKMEIPSSIGSKAVEYSISIPAKYAPNRPWPLIIGLHGGGENVGSGQQHMMASMEVSDVDAIYVCPTSVDLTVKYFWRCNRNAEMLALLIREITARYPIDPDRVYLSGYSMGGFGSYVLGAHMPDRFAAVAPGGGGWRGIHWASLLNTPYYIWHGKKDMRGKNFTNFPYAENAAALLKELGYEHELRAMDCGHSPVPPGEEKRMAEWLLKKKRNPYPKRIVTGNPRIPGNAEEFKDPSPDRWLAIDEIGTGKIEMDTVESGGEPRIKKSFKMGVLDASWTKPNTLEVKAENVKRFRVFLTSKLVDLKKPVTIVVNGKSLPEAAPKSSLPFLLKNLDERRDPGMVFVGEIPVEVPE